VNDYLASYGIQGSRLSTISYGEEKPAMEGHDESAWAKNRRVEFTTTF
jgi:peptidoglycan-associated lipoprotein